MRMQATSAAAIWLAMASFAAAQDAQLSDAVNLWLTGDDAASIEPLAKDAAAGDLAAQLILGQVDRDTLAGGFSPYILGLTREGRAEALRAKEADGSTINWLLALSDPDKASLGDALFWYEADLDPIEAALKLQINSEKVMAEYLLWHTFNTGRFDLVNSMPAENYGLSEAGFLKWMKAYFEGSNKSVSINGFLADASPYKIQGLLALKRLERLLKLQDNFSVGVNELITVVLGDGRKLPETADLVTLNASLRKIAEVDAPLSIVARMCGACPGIADDYQCMIQTFEIVGGYQTLLALRTPAEAAVPAETYIKSDRAVTALRDVVKGRSSYNIYPIRSSCIAGLVAGEF